MNNTYNPTTIPADMDVVEQMVKQYTRIESVNPDSLAALMYYQNQGRLTTAESAALDNVMAGFRKMFAPR